MFKESHEATRNVGMMGVVLAVLVLIGLYGLGAAFMTGMGLMGEDGKPLEVYVEQLKQDIKRAQEDLEKEKAVAGKLKNYQAVLEDIVELEKARDSGEEAVTEARSALELAQGEWEAEVAAFEQYRDQYRDVVRRKAEGEMVDLSASQGEGFENCKILGVSPLFLKVMTARGPVGVDYKELPEELPEELQDRFQFGEEEAAAYREWLKVQGERRDERIAAFREKQKTKRAEEAVEYRKREMESLQLKIAKMENQVAQLEAEAERWEAESKRFTMEAEQARANGRVTSKFGLASQATRKANGYRNRAKAVRVKIASAKKKLSELRAETSK